jgi:hypothetical protein
MAWSLSERRWKYRENHGYRARQIAKAKTYAKRHRERLRAKRHTPEFRAKRARYMRLWVLAGRIFEEWRFRTWMEGRRAA